MNPLYAIRYCAICADSHRVLSWSYDPARAMRLVDGLRLRNIPCTLEPRS